MRLVAITCARNEEDFIEAFARHTLAVADALVVLDHGSTDRTAEILRALAREGLALDPVHDPEPGNLQADHMNRLMRFAAGEARADLVLCLDADELLVADDLAVLRSADPLSRRVIRVPSYTYYARAEDDPLEPNPALRIRHRLAAEPWREAMAGSYKVLVPRALAEDPSAELGQGNHEVRIGGAVCEGDVLPGVRIAHFPMRSAAQYARKLVAKQIQKLRAVSATGDELDFYSDHYAVLREGFSAFAKAFPAMRLAYLPPHGEAALTNDPAPYAGGPLRYTVADGGADALVRDLIALGEHLARTPAAADAEERPTPVAFYVECVAAPEPGNRALFHGRSEFGGMVTVALPVDVPAASDELRFVVGGPPGICEIAAVRLIGHGMGERAEFAPADLREMLVVVDRAAMVPATCVARYLVSREPATLGLVGWRERVGFTPVEAELVMRFETRLLRPALLHPDVLNRLQADLLSSRQGQFRIARLEGDLKIAQARHLAAQNALDDCHRMLRRFTYRPGAILDFSDKGLAAVFMASGWGRPEDWGTWTDGRRAVLHLRFAEPVSGACSLEIEGLPFAGPKKRHYEMSLWIGRTAVASWPLEGNEPRVLRAQVPEGLIVGAEAELEFRVSDPRSPREFGMGGDDRLLGFGFHRFVLWAGVRG